MPLPIMPAGSINSFNNIFPNLQGDEVSVANKRFQKEPDYKDIIDLLEVIDKFQDNVVSAAASSVSPYEEKYYNVPQSISDENLLKLKTGGFCVGSGRTVKFSDKSKNLLKKKYLGTDNSFKSQRIKKQII